MRDPLDIILAERRREKAPKRLLDTLRARLRTERPKPISLRPIGIGIATSLAVAALLLSPNQEPATPPMSQAERAAVIDQTVASLVVIAEALEKAGMSGTETFLQASASPIRDGLESIKQKLFEPFTI